MKRLTLAIGCAVCASAIAFDGPLKVSANGRYLTFRSGEPFYYVADTPWQLLASLGIDDTREYIDIRATQGFTALQLVATPWSFDDTAAHWDTHLVTMHPRAGRSSADHLDAELDFHSIQERGDVASMVRRLQADYRRTPTKPTFLCETWYEHDRDGGVFGIHKTGTSAAFRAHYWVPAATRAARPERSRTRQKR